MSIGRTPSREQVRDATGRLKRRKVPGPDGVSAKLFPVEGLAEEWRRGLLRMCSDGGKEI